MPLVRSSAAFVVPVLALAITGCFVGPRQLAAGRRPAPPGEDCRATDDGAVITCEGSRYAEIGCRPDGRVRCRALWVEYAGGVRVWPYKPPGFDEAHPENCSRGNPKLDFEHVWPVIVARDGSRVWWWHRTPLSSGAFHVFHVIEDRVEDVDEADVWRIWALLHEGRAVALGGGSEPWPL